MKELEEKSEKNNIVQTDKKDESEELIEVLDEEEVLDSDSKMESYFSDEDYKSYFKMIKKFPVLTKEENIELALKAQNGDKDSLDKLTYHNLRFVVSKAKIYASKLKHMKIMDVIQEGTIGLIECVPSYNPEKGAFTTWAGVYIKGRIKRAIANKEAEIRKPVAIEEVKFKYKRIIDSCEKLREPIPTDEKLCEVLEISSETLEFLKQSEKLNPVSVNVKIGDEEDSELLDFVKDKDNSYDNVINKMDNHILFAVLKYILKPMDYYIVYYRFLSNTIKTLREIGNDFYVSYERIRQKEAAVLKKIKTYLDNNKTLYKNSLLELSKAKKIDWYNTNPIDPENIAMYLYIRDELSELERKILYYQFFGEYKIDYFIKQIGFSQENYNKINFSINEKIKMVYSNLDKFIRYKKNLLSHYGYEIFDIDFNGKIDIIDYEEIKERYSELSFEEILDIYSKYNIELNNDEFKLLVRYFSKPSKALWLPKERVEGEIYLLEYGFKDKRQSFSPAKLKKIFDNNLDKFTAEQKLFLKCYVFNLLERSQFWERYPQSHLAKHGLYLIKKLESLYYNIDGLFDNPFTKEKYLYVKEKYLDKLTPERIRLLDLYYGVNGKKHSKTELASMENEDYEKIHHFIDKAKSYCMSLYNNRFGTINVDPEIYIPYIYNPDIDLREETRCFLKMFIVDKMDYDEIRDQNNLGNIPISNVITDGLRRIDFYRYGIIESNIFTEKELEDFFKYYKDIITPIQKQVIILRKIQQMSNEEVARILKTDKLEVNNIIARFNRLYRKYQIKDVTIDENDILKEIQTHPSESVIDEVGKEFLSLYYGLTTQYNKKGIKLSKNELMEKYNISESVVKKRYFLLNDDIKAKKAGHLRNELSHISRIQLDKILDDPHLPISEKERDIICYLFELKGYPYKTIEEIEKMFNYSSKNNVKIRYNRAILSIYKYLNKEIEGKINFEIDVVPNLKYFSKSDTLFLTEFYKNELTNIEIAEKYHLTYDVVCQLINNLRDNLIELIENPNAKKFDFEYYREHREDSKLPFYGNFELIREVFELHIGESSLLPLDFTEIIEKLNLENAAPTLSVAVKDYILSFYELKDGIEKIVCFTDEEIQEYYDKHHLEMSKTHKQNYEMYFKRKSNTKYINVSQHGINYVIIEDLLKEKYPDFFNIENTTSEYIIKMLKKHKYVLNKKTKEYLMCKFNITEREFMSGKDKNHVYRILNKLSGLKMSPEVECILKRSLN